MTTTTTPCPTEMVLTLTGSFATAESWARAARMIAASVASAADDYPPTETDQLSVRVRDDHGQLLAGALIWLDPAQGYRVYPAIDGPGTEALHITGSGFLLPTDELCAPETCAIDGPLWEVLTDSHCALGH